MSCLILVVYCILLISNSISLYMHNIKGEAGQKVGQYYAVGLQDFTPKEGYYDLIWCQWVLSHLTNGTIKFGRV